MRILMVTPDPEGGIYHYSIELCRHLSDRHLDVSLATSKEHELQDKLNSAFNIIECFRFRRHYFFDMRWIRRLQVRRLYNAVVYLLSLVRLIRVSRRLKLDIIHVQGLFGSLLGLFTIRVLKGFSGSPLADTVHNLAPRRRYFGERLTARLTLEAIDGLIVHSAYGKRQFQRQHDIPEARIHVIPHGNYLFFSERTIPQPTEARQRIGLPEDARAILFFGFIKPYKGLNHLIEALPQVLDAVPNAFIVIAGKPIEDFGKYDKLINQVGIRERVLTKLDYIPVDSVPDYFVAADVVALPYTQVNEEAVAVDHSGIAQLAYAFAKPVVVSSIGGLTEVVDDGESGYRVEPGNSHQLASKLIAILSDSKKLDQMGKWGRHLATTRFGWNTIAALHEVTYRSIVTGAH